MSVKVLSFGGDVDPLPNLEVHMRSDLLRLENFLMEEFPGQLVEGDSFIHSAISIMRGLKNKLTAYGDGSDKPVFLERKL